jgi:hypothetical protein
MIFCTLAHILWLSSSSGTRTVGEHTPSLMKGPMMLTPIRSTFTILAMLVLVGCSHSSASSSPGVAIAVQPTNLTIAPGLSAPIAARVTGSSDISILWSVTEGLAGGSVTGQGLYTAPSAEGTYHVIATSHADPSKSEAVVILVSSSQTSTAPSGGTSGTGGLFQSAGGAIASGGAGGGGGAAGGTTGIGGNARTGGNGRTGGNATTGGITGAGGTVSTGGTDMATTGTSTSGALTAVLVASRAGGYAPLAVHFDATGSTSTTAGISDAAQGGTFRQIKHAFDFGDPNSGTHSISGLSRNTEPSGGGLAAHVFESPGTYTVTVKSTDGSGATASASVTITVKDSSMLTTYAISKTGSFAGAPAGSKQLTQSKMPTFASNSRYFFNRGEDWSNSGISIQDPLTNVHVDAYGTGANPVFNSVAVGTDRPATTTFATDIRVSNVSSNSGFQQENGSRVLFHNCSGKPISSSGAGYTHVDTLSTIPPSAYANSYEVFYVDCQLQGDGVTANANYYGNGSRLVFLDTTIAAAAATNIRIVGWERGIMRHCRVENPYLDDSVHALKVHAGGPHPYADNWLASGGQNSETTNYVNWISDKIVIANTTFGGGNNGSALANWTIAICPENDQYGINGGAEAELLQNVILENNTFIHATGWNPGNGNLDIAWGGRNFTSRNNSVQGGGALVVGGGHAEVAAYDGPYFKN